MSDNKPFNSPDQGWWLCRGTVKKTRGPDKKPRKKRKPTTNAGEAKE